MKVLIAVESHFKEYGGPYTAITQAVEYLNKKKIHNKLIFKNSNYFSYSLDLEYIIKDFDIVHIYGIWRPFLVKVFLISKKLKKKNYYQSNRCIRTMVTKSKKIKKKISLVYLSKKNFRYYRFNSCNE